MRHSFFYSLALCVVVAGGQVSAQEPINPYWDMQTPWASYGASTSCSFSSLSPGNNYGNTVFLSESSSSAGYTGASGGWNASLAARSGPLQKESLGSAFIEFSITPAPGFRFVLKAVSFGARSTQTGPAQWSLFQQEDQYTTSLAQGAISTNSIWSLVAVDGINFNAAKTVSFRIYGFDGLGSPAINVANWRIDDLMLQLQVVPDNLPVKWLYQRVKTAPGKVLVEWATEEEVDVQSFIIQRSSDALHFENIAQVFPQSGVGSLPATLYYNYVDTIPLPGQSFYRILQRDISGSVEVSEVFLVQQQDIQQSLTRSKLFYSPSSGVLKLPVDYSGPVVLQLFSVSGQLTGHYKLFAYRGVIKFNPPHWIQGYQIVVLAAPYRGNTTHSFSTISYFN